MGLFNFLKRHSSHSSAASSSHQSEYSSQSQVPGSPLSSHSTQEKFPFYEHDHSLFHRSHSNMSPTIQTIVQEPSKTEEVGGRETGFPEPLSPYRNTTLPHPEADTSPNATISAPEISPRGLSHTRSRSFLSRKGSYNKTHRTTKSQEIKNGTVTTLPMPADGEKGLYEGIVYAADEDGRSSSAEDSRGKEESDGTGEKKRHVLHKLRH